VRAQAYYDSRQELHAVQDESDNLQHAPADSDHTGHEFTDGAVASEAADDDLAYAAS
jgi:hypothetical protein